MSTAGMNTRWHSLKNLNKTESNEISAEVTLTTESLWFDGHFPGSPILPGIAQLAIVSDMIRGHARMKSRSVSVSRITKVRFRQFVRPGDTLQMSAAADATDPSAYKFRVLVNGQIACNGVMTMAERAG
ncbi:MAG: hypothetical protein JW807_09005 [Spirochaetes bacterium]|nr:hypothetical protein [Spirochaetota bacterium]